MSFTLKVYEFDFCSMLMQSKLEKFTMHTLTVMDLGRLESFM